MRRSLQLVRFFRPTAAVLLVFLCLPLADIHAFCRNQRNQRILYRESSSCVSSISGSCFHHAVRLSKTSLASTPATTTTTSTSSTTTAAPKRTGLGQWLLNAALASPLWQYVLVPQARRKMQETALDNGIDWNHHKEWLEAQAGPWQTEETVRAESYSYPSYYHQPFHAYPEGNLCWEAALEAEIASAAVGARNFPQYGAQGEEAFRGAFVGALDEAGATLPSEATCIVDLGCGTGMSTRRLALQYPQVPSIVGIDLSPYFCSVGTKLLQLAPHNEEWVSSIPPQLQERIEYRVGDAAATQLPNDCADVVNLQFVLHELPLSASQRVVEEAYRILKPGGQLWVCEMDFEAPAYAAQRANALFFALIRATEPYLDDYAEGETELRHFVQRKFATTTVTPATGRHYALVATKHVRPQDDDADCRPGTLEDLRFHPDGNYRVEDTHLKVWENKQAI